jgi:hypothetical protein
VYQEEFEVMANCLLSYDLTKYERRCDPLLACRISQAHLACMCGSHWQHRKMACALDCNCQSTLHLGRNTSAATGKNFALRCQVLLQALYIFVVRLNTEFRKLTFAAARTWLP